MSRNEETATAEYCSGFTKGLVDNVCKKVEVDDQGKEEVKQAPKEELKTEQPAPAQPQPSKKKNKNKKK